LCKLVTGVQTCALPISSAPLGRADGFRRRGQVVRMKETADAAADRAGVRTVIIARRLGCEVRLRDRDVWWDDVVASGSGGDQTSSEVGRVGKEVWSW